ncbi:ATP-grasp domain-containing protein, partial [Candidatus Bathyarchaeota archaeon]|nr:ATP-grasp domain-containing protein [Candidatus Bathyarchaeota archaeon]
MESLAQLVHQLDIELLIPMDDPECDLLSDYRNRSRLDSEVALPPKEIYEFARNKYKTFEQAVKLGLRVPRTILVQDMPALQRAISDVQMPMVVKPIRSSGSRGVFLLRKGHLPPSFTGAFERYGPLIMQDLIPSTEALGVSCLVNNGEILASFTHRRVLQFPESGGPSIVRESARNE